MNIETIIKLLDAGYTKEEIQQLAQPTQITGAEVSPPGTDDTHSPSAPDANDPEPAAPSITPAPEASGSNDQLLKAINDLTKTIQSGAILNSVFNSDNERTSDAILASILRPDGSKLGGDK